MFVVRRRFEYKKGVYAYVHYTLKNGVLKSEKEGTYTSDNMIERIVVYTETVPKSGESWKR